jgi:hypothetical protein
MRREQLAMVNKLRDKTENNDDPRLWILSQYNSGKFLL